MHSRLPIWIVVPLFCALALAGCRDEQAVTYRVPKESHAAPAAPAASTPASAPMASGSGAAPATPADAQAAMAAQAVPTAGDDALAWSAPAHWQAGPTKPMRKATFLVPAGAGVTGSAELAITAFPGDVGGNLANVNRWRQQLGLPGIAAADLGAALQHLHVGALHVDVVELVGAAEPRQRVLGAIVPVAGATWFFKLSGPDALVAAEKEAFLAFLHTLKPRA